MKKKTIQSGKLLNTVKFIGVGLVTLLVLGLVSSLFTGGVSGGVGSARPSVNNPSGGSSGNGSYLPDSPSTTYKMKSEVNGDRFNYFVNPTDISRLLNTSNSENHSGVGTYEYRIEENGVPYIRIYGDGKSSNAYMLLNDFGDSSTGKYLYFAYRLPASNKEKSNVLEFNASTISNTVIGEGDSFSVKAVQDNEWQVVCVDMEVAVSNQANILNGLYDSKFVASEDGTYSVDYLKFNFFNKKMSATSYIDIAYIGINNQSLYNFDADFDFATYDAQDLKSILGDKAVLKNDSGLEYVTITDTTSDEGNSGVTFYHDDAILPNTGNYVVIVYRNAPDGDYQTVCNNGYNVSGFDNTGFYYQDDAWHFTVLVYDNSSAGHRTLFNNFACRKFIFNYFNNMESNTKYSIDIAVVKCFEDSAGAVNYHDYLSELYGIDFVYFRTLEEW